MPALIAKTVPATAYAAAVRALAIAKQKHAWARPWRSATGSLPSGGGGGGQAWCIEFPDCRRYGEWEELRTVCVPQFVAEPIAERETIEWPDLRVALELPRIELRPDNDSIYRPHARGLEGAVESARTVSVVAWNARLSEHVRAFVLGALEDAGRPASAFDKLSALMLAVRERLTYLSDPTDAERITNPVFLAEKVMLGEPVSGDCADHVGLFVAAAANIGHRAAVVVQSREGEQAHLIAAVKVGRKWVYFDPSSRDLPAGERLEAESEIWVPLPGASVRGRDVVAEDSPASFVGVAGADTWMAPMAAQAVVPWSGEFPKWALVLVSMIVGGLLVYALVRWTQKSKARAGDRLALSK